MKMCGGIYEEDFNEDPLEKNERVDFGGGWMNDLEFTTAGDFMREQEDKYCYPGSDPQV